MQPFLRFLAAARSLANQGMSKEAIEQFAKNEFGKINTLMQKQINNIFKPSKPVGKKDEVFDSTVEKMQFDDQGKPFNPRNPTKDYSKKAEGGIMRVGLKDGVLKRGLKAITGTDTYKTLENRGFNAALLMNEGFDQIYNLLSGVPGLAEGGRIGYKDGPEKPGRRTFMKAAAGLASLLPFGAAKIVGKAAPVVAKAAEITGPALAKIVDTVMSLGKLVSVKGRKVKEMVTKKKHEGVEVTEDIQDQSFIIKKGDKEIYYKPGKMDETGGIEDDIIEVIEKRIQKAGGGGIGYMLGE